MQQGEKEWVAEGMKMVKENVDVVVDVGQDLRSEVTSAGFGTRKGRCSTCNAASARQACVQGRWQNQMAGATGRIHRLRPRWSLASFQIVWLAILIQSIVSHFNVSRIPVYLAQDQASTW